MNKLDAVITSLSENSEASSTALYIFQDGPRNDSDLKEINRILEFTNNIKGFREIKVYKNEVNLGLSKSITSGLTKFFETHTRAIVLEDDLVVSRNFLNYMNSGLDLYENENDVASIHGYLYPTISNMPQTFFLRGADCWGWATWRRAWKRFNNDGRYLLKKIQESKDREIFDFEGYGGYINMLQDANEGRNDSWAIKWYTSTFLEEMYTLYPGKTLVKNIGMDGTGVHRGENNKISNQKIGQDVKMQKIPIKDNEKARKAFVKYFKSQNYYLMNKILNRIRNVLIR